MVTPTDSQHPNAAPPQDGTADTSAAQVNRALVNLGDTSRASWKFSTDTIRANIAYMSPDAKELLLWAFNWCIDPAHPIRFEDFADRLGYSSNKLWKLYSGKDKHPTNGKLMDASAALVKALRAFRRIEVARGKLGQTQFVLTPTAQRIFTACDLARESQTPVLLEGASQIGKTTSGREYCTLNNHGKSRMIELEAVSGLHGLVKLVAAVCGVSPNGNAADLTERLKRAITADMVLFFDEVHLLANTYRRGSFFACMEWIRRLHDATRCGIVLSFTTLGFSKAEAERKRELEQLFRRGVHRVNLGTQPVLADVKTILGSWGLEMPARKDEVEIKIGAATLREEPYKMLAQLSREQGLKAIVERLRYASKFAADSDGPLTWDHVVHAHAVIESNAATPNHGWAA